jgi:hypothetical protein
VVSAATATVDSAVIAMAAAIAATVRAADVTMPTQ